MKEWDIGKGQEKIEGKKEREGNAGREREGSRAKNIWHDIQLVAK
jgi:hypothetical protein